MMSGSMGTMTCSIIGPYWSPRTYLGRIGKGFGRGGKERKGWKERGGGWRDGTQYAHTCVEPGHVNQHSIKPPPPFLFIHPRFLISLILIPHLESPISTTYLMAVADCITTGSSGSPRHCKRPWTAVPSASSWSYLMIENIWMDQHARARR